ncbi:MAG: exo-beta-N-acetylmuramidase NamZ domain-containing protein [Alphaproteobacteria bacterium]
MNSTDRHADIRKRALSGLDRLLHDETMVRRLAARQVGLLTNHACTTVDQIPATQAIKQSLDIHGAGSLRLFTPEHGIQLSAGAGEAVTNCEDPLTGLPVYSLYEGTENNADVVLEGLDVLIIDLRDVGVRCYTYAATAARFATAALERHIEIIVCDRVNPLGPKTEGPRPEPERKSLLAYFDVPFVHGRTIGELIALAIAPVITQAPFAVYPADVFLQPPLGWIPPSPALSHPDAVAAYAGLVLLEATNISEGRGTSVSFRSVAAPGLDAIGLARAVNEWPTGFGAASGEIFFTRPPSAGQPVPGIGLWPRRAPRHEPLALGIYLLSWLMKNYEDFAWLPAAGSESDMAIDVLFGRSDLRTQLEAGRSAEAILRDWR